MSQKPNREVPQHLSDAARRLFGHTDELSVASELAALRAEVRELRETLCPPKSMLIIGPEVERVMAALKGGAA